ncbi:hypothetical protein HYW54_02550 [Candidatus Gottesmanbacteria bacterium]|nr:hypothetical protein [Candidatus Gottesmanbacteria bacterium]
MISLTNFWVYAQETGETQLGCGEGFGPFADVFCGKGGFDLGLLLNNFISAILGLLTIIAALYFFFQIITAGIAWIGAGGDKNSVEQARSKIFNALIGLVVVAAAWVLVGIIGTFVGIKVLDPGSLIPALQIYPKGN